MSTGRVSTSSTSTPCARACTDGSAGLIQHVADKFGQYIEQVSAVNFGGGHFLNKPGYDVDVLIDAIKDFKARFGVDVILEPGAGLVVNTGELYSTVLALHWNEMDLAILDASASTHMPDVLEVPYRPDIVGAGQPGEKPLHLPPRRQDLHDG
jgi:carboxynorspermidine decarboxylase